MNGSAKQNLHIFPTNIEQDQWFLKMHHQSEEHNARDWFDNEFLETIYDKFETNFLKGGTFCRDCEEKLFTINADGTISGCPNSAPEFQFGTIDDDIESLINSPIRIENIACCGAPKSLMRFLKSNQKRKVWILKDGNINEPYKNTEYS